MNPDCKCPEAGYCPLHKMLKLGRMFKLCKGTAETPDCGKKYWNGWNRGRMGATIPDTSGFAEEWDCDSAGNETKREQRASIDLRRHRAHQESIEAVPIVVEGPGTELHKIFTSMGFQIKKGCSCKWWINRMNTGGLEWCEEHMDDMLDYLVSEFESRNWKPLAGMLNPFTKIVAKKCIRTAMERARRNAE